MAAIVPRYASRREDGSVVIVAESLIMRQVAQTGIGIVQSPLLFQGGNLMAIRKPDSTELVLLIGEAEVYRNQSLGLSRQQVLDAFTQQMGVSQCLVLPAVSFHIDFDLCVRTIGDRTVAFVNDPIWAARMILSAGFDAMENHGAMDAVSILSARTYLETGRLDRLVELLGRLLADKLTPHGQFRESFARVFSTSVVDSHVGNLQRFLYALDVLAHRHIPPHNRFSEAYHRALSRKEDDVAKLAKLLADFGCDVVKVPGFADGSRTTCYLNGVQLADRYLMPAYGGLLAPLDRAAETVFRQVMGPEVDIIPIHCAETQRRAGGVHCSVNVHTRTGPSPTSVTD